MSETPLAFWIVSDLLFSEIIREDVSPADAQFVVQKRLDLDPRFRKEKVVHFQHNKRKFSAVCNQMGEVETTDDTTKVTCMRCLRMFRVHGTYERW